MLPAFSPSNEKFAIDVSILPSKAFATCFTAFACIESSSVAKVAVVNVLVCSKENMVWYSTDVIFGFIKFSKSYICLG